VGRGTGLGLATVYGIVQQSGGHVTVSSKPGCGAVFHVFLPRAARVSEEASAPVLPDSVPLEGTETLLLAEDEDGVRELISGSLAAYGYTVLPARDGAEALEIGKTHRGPIHLLLTDFVMPQMNGADLAAQLSATLPEPRVLYISGYTNDALVQRQANVSHTNFLPKPFSMEDLARAIRAVLSKETATDNKKDLSMSAQTG
jgi:CheY-like chemotaxis protein